MEKFGTFYKNYTKALFTYLMRKIGSSGYWDITMNLPEGEHRFIYILNGKQRFADPTVMSREHDDFGGENSIISVEPKT
jgi:hypothetical protein